MPNYVPLETTLRHLAIFCALLAACRVLVLNATVARGVDRATAALAAFLRARGLFVVDDVAAEQRRLDVLRIVLMILACVGLARNLGAAIVLTAPAPILWQVTALVLALLTLVGLATPVAALLFAVLLNVVVDPLSQSTNLASMVLGMCMTALAFAPIGRTASLDALLMRRRGRVGRLLSGLYSFWGSLTADRAALARSFALAGYAAVSLSSGFAHLRDEAWQSGALLAWLLVAPTTNPVYVELADRAYREMPAVYVVMSRAATYAMLVWYLGMVPLVLLGRWTRRFVVVWGLIFFGFSAVVLPLRMLGIYELLLWALIFGDRPRWARPFWRRFCQSRMGSRLRRLSVAVLPSSWTRTPTETTVAPASALRRDGAAAPPLGTVFRTLALSAAVLLVAYLVRLPVVRQIPGGAALAALSEATVQAATLAYGMGPINVFNSEDLLSQRLDLGFWWSDGTERISSFVDLGPYLSDTELYTLAQFQRDRATNRTFCDEAFVHEYLAPFASRYTSLTLPAKPVERLFFHASFGYHSWPTLEDFAALRYAPVEYWPICEVVVDAQTSTPFVTLFTERGTELMTRDHELPFPVPPQSMPLLVRFPCAAETARVQAWIGSSDLVARRPEAVAAATTILEGLDARNLIACFVDVQAATSALDLDWRRENPPPKGECGADLALAEAYFDEALTDELRVAVRPSLNRAAIASARSDAPTCLLAASAVRRTYLRALGAVEARSELDQSAVGGDLPFRVREAAVPLLEQFPCEAERQRISWWLERPDLLPRGPAADSAADLALNPWPGPWEDPIACFERAEAAVAALGLDWREADPPPSRAVCEPDLGLARVYMGQVFDEHRRTAVRPHLDQAVAMQQQGDHQACLLAAAEVRRTYLYAVGARDREPAQSSAQTRLAGVPFAVRTDALPLLDQFPCQAEARRVAWWFDRPELASRGPTAAAVVPTVLSDVSDLSAVACFSAIQQALDTIDLDWRGAHTPPPGAACDVDLELATAYFDTVFDEPLQRRTQSNVDLAIAARQEGDHTACLLATAGVRRTFLDAVMATDGP